MVMTWKIVSYRRSTI